MPGIAIPRSPPSWSGASTRPRRPPECDPTDEILVAPLEPGIADVGLLVLAASIRMFASFSPANAKDPKTIRQQSGAR